MRPEKNHRPPAGPSGGPGSNGGGATSRRLLRSTLTGSPDTLHAYDAFGRQATVAHTAVWDPAEPAATRPLLLQTPSGWHTYSFDQVKEQKSAKLKPKVQGDRDFEAVRTYGARSGIPRRSGNCYVSELFDPSGNIAATYDFGPFGEDMAASGPAAALNPFRFSSEVWDAALGLVQYTFRPYNPLDGRFLNRDPIEEEGGLNLYGFVGNDPVDAIEYLGLESSITIKELPVVYTDHPLPDFAGDTFDSGRVTYSPNPPRHLPRCKCVAKDEYTLELTIEIVLTTKIPGLKAKHPKTGKTRTAEGVKNSESHEALHRKMLVDLFEKVKTSYSPLTSKTWKTRFDCEKEVTPIKNQNDLRIKLGIRMEEKHAGEHWTEWFKEHGKEPIW
jgi:RHS repeat-associated protein